MKVIDYTIPFPDWSGADFKVDYYEAKNIADRRINNLPESHVFRTTYREDGRNWILGAMGEIAFSMWTGLPMNDEHITEYGDNGLDFWLNFDKLKLDVKVAEKPYNLLEKVHKIKRGNCSDVYVLGRANISTGWVSFLGFEYVEALQDAPEKLFHENGKIDKYIHWTTLRSLAELETLLRRNNAFGE